MGKEKLMQPLLHQHFVSVKTSHRERERGPVVLQYWFSSWILIKYWNIFLSDNKNHIVKCNLLARLELRKRSHSTRHLNLFQWPINSFQLYPFTKSRDIFVIQPAFDYFLPLWFCIEMACLSLNNNNAWPTPLLG